MPTKPEFMDFEKMPDCDFCHNGWDGEEEIERVKRKSDFKAIYKTKNKEPRTVHVCKTCANRRSNYFEIIGVCPLGKIK